MSDVFALLDDALAPATAPRSRLYTGWVREHRCTDPATLAEVWRAVETDQRAGLHALLLMDYEWGLPLNHLPATAPPAALRVLMFRHCARLGADAVTQWLAEREGQPTPAPAGVMAAHPALTQREHAHAIDAVQDAIRQGRTYQVNFTYPWNGTLVGTPVALYRRLRATQPVAFGALMALPDNDGTGNQRWVLSCSPELFVRVQAGRIEAQPMKGTAPRLPDPQQDATQAQTLARDPKNRAENLMIVDLLRNDLGRIAQTGSVRVPALFEVQTLPTVFQMTSTITAQPLPAVDVPALLRATFPCGSITGAPKRETMRLIQQLETEPRGLYCGAIGWVDTPPEAPAAGRLPDLCLSVAIRTLTLTEPPGGWTRAPSPVRWGVGGGIVLDSVSATEWEETHWKTRFVRACDPGFALIETLRVEPDGQVVLWARHLERLRHSANVLGWPLGEAEDATVLWQRIQAAAADCRAAGQTGRVRLTLAFDGRVALTCTPLPPLPPTPDGRVRLGQARQRLPGAHALSAHKTTLRAHYDAAVQAAERLGGFDLLFFDEADELIEGGRSTVWVQLAGRWYTPPVSRGALPGVMRAELLAHPPAEERRLTRADLAQAQDLRVSNALRGVLPARWCPDVMD